MGCSGVPSLLAPWQGHPTPTCLSSATRSRAARLRALQVYGAVLNINRGNPGDFEVAVDAWPNFSAVLHPAPQAPLNDSYRNLCSAFYRDVGAYRALLESPGCLRWDSAFHIFGGCGDNHGDAGGTRSDGSGVVVSGTGGAGNVQGTEGSLGTLSPAHVELLDSTWPYGGNAWSRRYLGELLRRFPYLCLQDPAGDLLCWVLSDGFAAGAHGYTVPAQRRRGLMRALTIMAARRAHGRGFPVYGHTATGNRGMQRLQEDLGHRRVPGLCRFVLHNPALARAAP
uniref:Glycine N-acyltransferase-like protein n=1 Tax=Phasianus colchicus TaxID=9054 RepID=A0A669QWI3_PHACC